MICYICGWPIDADRIDEGVCKACEKEAEREVYEEEVECQSKREIRVTKKDRHFR